jgi:hypothetical protein
MVPKLNTLQHTQIHEKSKDAQMAKNFFSLLQLEDSFPSESLGLWTLSIPEF